MKKAKMCRHTHYFKTSFGVPRVGCDPPVKKCGIRPLAFFRPFCPKLCFSAVDYGPL